MPTLRLGLGTVNDTFTPNRPVRGEIGAIANQIAFSAANKARLTGAGYPANLFVTNPTVVNGGAFLMTNGGHSTFNAFQTEVRRRMKNGLMVQGSYAFSKALSNMLASSSAVFSQPTTFRNSKLDKGPSPWGVRHAIKGN